MKIIVDKLPTKKEDCLFCFQETGSVHKSNCHKCFFKMSDYEFGGLHTSMKNCFLTQGLKCPYLKEMFSQEDNDTVYVNDKGEIIGI